MNRLLAGLSAAAALAVTFTAHAQPLEPGPSPHADAPDPSSTGFADNGVAVLLGSITSEPTEQHGDVAGAVTTGSGVAMQVLTPPAGVVVDRNPTMANIGMGITIAGSVMATVGTAVTIHLANQEGDFAGLGAAVTGGPIIGVGGILMLIGIPLWAVGESNVTVPPDDPRVEKQRAARRAPETPTLAVGMGDVSLSWRY